MPHSESASTRQQLLDAAGKLFAEHGFDGASTRSIVDAAGANLAAIHYHFGSKQALYQAVLNQVCEHHQEVFRQGAVPALAPDSPQAIAGLIRQRVALLFDVLTGPRAVPWMAQLVVHEIAQPSSAHALIVERLFAPVHAQWVALYGQVRPTASAVEAHVWALHMPAMVRFVLTARPTIAMVLGQGASEAAFLAEVVRQTAESMIKLLDLPTSEKARP